MTGGTFSRFQETVIDNQPVYLISDVYGLQGMKYHLDRSYALSNDIDAAVTRFWHPYPPDIVPPAYYLGFEPIGGYANAFTGSLNGQNHTISNLHINRPEISNGQEIGLFGEIAASARIENVGLINVDITALDNVGGLVGVNVGGIISNAYVTGNIRASDAVGGIVGWNSGKIIYCHATGVVTGGSGSGGLVGWNFGDIDNSYAAVDIYGVEWIGGLVGVNYETISKCYSTGTVNGDLSRSSGVGGFVGCNQRTISQSYSTGIVNGFNEVGGFVGLFEGGYPGGLIADCYSTGTVNGNDSVGGLVGHVDYHNMNTISHCYAISSVNGHSNVGGLVGCDSGSSNTYTANFWLKDANHNPNLQDIGNLGDVDGITGKSTAEMKDPNTFINAGWQSSIWFFQPRGVSYPILRWQIPRK